ncbi:MAG: uroporphyrinogen decarboxylase family protein [Phycisphaerae bacterium]|jgi:uroporphyrinogen decarboxylase|nr:uroporphyrinogen decarboxylase family protein [Phycisphaerae bacterium]
MSASKSAIPLGMAVYEHAAALIGAGLWETSRSEELMFASHAKAYETYQHSPVVVGIDIYNLEAEALGATVAPGGPNAIPAIVDHPFSSLDDLLGLDDFDPAAGRIPLVLGAARRIAEKHPQADVRIPVAGPFSIAFNLVNLETLLCEMLADPEKGAAALRRIAEAQVDFCREIHRSGLDIALFESAATPPMLSPETFEQMELPVLKDLLTRAAEIVDHPLPCIIGGDTTPILEAMLSTGTGYVVCPAETDQAAFMDIMARHSDITVRVNMDSGVMSRGRSDEIRAEIRRIIDLVGDRPKCCIGTGAIPYETPPQAILGAKEYLAELTG